MISGDPPSPRGLLPAREQLRRLVGDPRGARLVSTTGWPEAEGESRAAAVLMLFGMLDARSSDHRAHEGAVSRDLDVLLLRRAATLRSHAGQVAFPGGRIDPGDAGPVEAALREAHEETGLDPDGVEVLGALEDIPLPYSAHLVTPVLGWWTRPSSVRVVDVAESAFVFRVPVADLLDPASRYTSVVERDGRTRTGPAFLVHAEGVEHLVWGFTAFLLDGLFDALGWTEAWDGERTLVVT
ncbi:CoA pyrophosphatase [Rathayibacter sp. YIM 133350]|uniref:NUDIX hydrolase n=1 Tax=Rathayibacter sp. YIM 133350 TaxID=3131992 RepID=UPI00307CFACB